MNEIDLISSEAHKCILILCYKIAIWMEPGAYDNNNNNKSNKGNIAQKQTLQN